jgi:hypothetical protein
MLISPFASACSYYGLYAMLQTLFPFPLSSVPLFYRQLSAVAGLLLPRMTFECTSVGRTVFEGRTISESLVAGVRVSACLASRRVSTAPFPYFWSTELVSARGSAVVPPAVLLLTVPSNCKTTSYNIPRVKQRIPRYVELTAVYPSTDYPSLIADITGYSAETSEYILPSLALAKP